MKFTPPGEAVLVRVEVLGLFVLLDVLDTGQGIPHAASAYHLFDRFYRLASTSEQGIPGSGLGLAIVRSVAEAHEGTVAVIDSPGWSTTFRVLLPRATTSWSRIDGRPDEDATAAPPVAPQPDDDATTHWVGGPGRSARTP